MLTGTERALINLCIICDNITKTTDISRHKQVLALLIEEQMSKPPKNEL